MTSFPVRAVAIFTLFAGPAIAADIPAKAPVRPGASAPYSWNGFYIGANAGYSFGKTDIDYSTPFAAVGTSVRPERWLGGAQIGYNWQTGPWVYGVESDFAFRNGTKASRFQFGSTPTAGNPFGSVAGDNTVFRVEQNWIGTTRGQVGYAWNNWMVYGTGGLAYGDSKHLVTETSAAVNQTRVQTSADQIDVGWTAGAGAKLGAGQWSLGLEYLYADLGKSTISQPASTNVVVFPADSTRFRDTSHLVRFKLDYAIGAPVPVK